AVCADAQGLSRRVALAPGQVLLVDERYFLRRPVDPGLCDAGQDDRAADAGMDFDVPAGAVALPEAQLILSGGDGVQDWESLAAVAELLGATVGATKVVCDKGLQPRARQVGSSGTAVSPRVYLALGISGSTQHLQGVAEAASVLAVNTDPNAAIARRAELLLVADANAVLRALRSTLQAGERT
ncbi:MAG TPA: FAD-binding protein, partial [Pseudorhodoferax sp.]|nr:FAD-binding protein [Pseudorhodoferax sp.]